MVATPARRRRAASSCAPTPASSTATTRSSSRASGKFTGGDKAARDHVWLKKDEWQSLIPADPKKGDVFAMPAALARRLCRFHLVDNTRGEPEYWRSEQVRKMDLKWTVKDVSGGELALELVRLRPADDGGRRREIRSAATTRRCAACCATTGRRGRHEAGDRRRSATTGPIDVHPGDGPAASRLAWRSSRVTGDQPDQRVPPQAGRRSPRTSREVIV